MHWNKFLWAGKITVTKVKKPWINKGQTNWERNTYMIQKDPDVPKKFEMRHHMIFNVAHKKSVNELYGEEGILSSIVNFWRWRLITIRQDLRFEFYISLQDVCNNLTWIKSMVHLNYWTNVEHHAHAILWQNWKWQAGSIRSSFSRFVQSHVVVVVFVWAKKFSAVIKVNQMIISHHHVCVYIFSVYTYTLP